jgi:general stress protein 26
MDISKQIYEFLNQHELMVVSTVSSRGIPQSALVGFGQTEELEIIFATSKKTRKATNIEHDSHVSVVVGGDKGVTLQYEGIANLIESDKKDFYADLQILKSPRTAMLKEDPDMQYYLIKPNWIRLTDVTKKPWDVQELSL